jgi:hypothetical protein
MTDVTVSPEQVVQILCRDPLGLAMWRAAANEALADAYRERLEAAEKNQKPAEFRE